MSRAQLAVLSDDKGHTLSASKAWGLRELPKEGTMILVEGFDFQTRIERVTPEGDAVVLLPRKKVETLLAVPGGKWVDYYALKRKEAEARIKTTAGSA